MVNLSSHQVSGAFIVGDRVSAPHREGWACWVVRIGLAIYLSPVLLLVVAIGGLFVSIGGVARRARRTRAWLRGTRKFRHPAALAKLERQAQGEARRYGRAHVAH